LGLTVSDIKELLGSVYASYIGDQVGLRTELLHNLMTALKPSVDIETYKELVVSDLSAIVYICITNHFALSTDRETASRGRKSDGCTAYPCECAAQLH
jgi:hypothetical protein